jgi:hypothetical protein
MNFVQSLWDNHRAKIGLSVFCVLVALFDTFAKSLSIVAATALSIAIVPWVVSFIEKLSLPGGFELVLAKAEQRLDAAANVPDQKDIDAFKYLSGNDPNMAIALLRIQIERRLREIAEHVMIEPESRGRPRSLRMLADELAKQGAITTDALALIHDLMPVMNEAVHGTHLNAGASTFALEYGPKILAMLRLPDTPN